MKVICNQSVLTKALNIVTKAVPTRSTMQLLQGIHLEASEDGFLTLSSSDMEISIQKKIDAEVTEAGSMVVPSKLFNDIVRKMPEEEIKLDGNDGNIVVKSGKSKFKINCFENGEDFPKFSPLGGESIAEISFNKETFKDMVKRTSFAASVDETKGILTGILTEIDGNKAKMVAVDGFRLAVVNEEIESNANCKFVLASRVMNDICKIVAEEDTEDLFINLSDKKVYVTIGGTNILVTLMHGEYLNYEQIIPRDGQLTVVVDKKQLHDCLERASLFAKEGKNNLIKMEITDKDIFISSRSEEGDVNEQISVDVFGDGITIGFNAKFLLDTLKAINDESVTLQLKAPTAPCVVKPIDSNDYEYLVLPVRI